MAVGHPPHAGISEPGQKSFRASHVYCHCVLILNQERGGDQNYHANRNPDGVQIAVPSATAKASGSHALKDHLLPASKLQFDSQQHTQLLLKSLLIASRTTLACIILLMSWPWSDIPWATLANWRSIFDLFLWRPATPCPPRSTPI